MVEDPGHHDLRPFEDLAPLRLLYHSLVLRFGVVHAGPLQRVIRVKLTVGVHLTVMSVHHWMLRAAVHDMAVHLPIPFKDRFRAHSYMAGCSVLGVPRRHRTGRAVGKHHVGWLAGRAARVVGRWHR